MFNIILTVNELFSLILFSFFTLFTFRRLFIKRVIFIILYHVFLFLVLFVAAIGGGSVQNERYARLEEFILLEKNHQLENARNNLQNYDEMLQIDLKLFKSSDELRDYIKGYDDVVDKAEAISIGWLFVLLAEISMMLASLISYIFRKIKNS